MDATSSVPQQVRARARESIGATLRLADRTDDPTQARELRRAGLHAFRSSMHVTYAIAVVIVLGAVVVAGWFLPARAVDPPARRPGDTDEAMLAAAESAA